jgi:hypothetical protein
MTREFEIKPSATVTVRLPLKVYVDVVSLANERGERKLSNLLRALVIAGLETVKRGEVQPCEGK